MGSKLPIARTFRRWVLSDLLPKIRKTGQEQFIRELEAERQLRLDVEQRLKRAEQTQLRMERFINLTKSLEINQVIYIGTTDAYQRQNRFKVGGCSTKELLVGRFSGYNSGRPTDDRFFCAKYWMVHSYRLVEDIAKTLLVNFKDSQNKKGEDYHLNGAALVMALNYIIENSNENVEWFNGRLNDFVNQTIHAEPTRFEPVELGRQTLCITAGDHKVELADITNWSEEQVRAEIDEIFELYKTRKNVGSLAEGTILWKDLSEIIKHRYRRPE